MSASSSPTSAGASVGLFQSQRFLPGTSRAEIAAFDASIRAAPEPPQFDSFQGTFATQEYLQATISQTTAQCKSAGCSDVRRPRADDTGLLLSAASDFESGNTQPLQSSCMLCGLKLLTHYALRCLHFTRVVRSVSLLLSAAACFRSEYDPSAIERIITLPPQHDPSVWQYESLRQILLELSSFINELGCASGASAADGSTRTACTAQSCPKMCATDQWVFLCAAHPAEPGKKMAPKECCAMDWMLHTLAGFNALMNSQDDFPNRYTISAKSTRHFADMGRRLYRVFAHAFYHHREVFDEIEARTHLTERFMAFCLHFELMKAAQLEPPIQIKPRE